MDNYTFIIIEATLIIAIVIGVTIYWRYYRRHYRDRAILSEIFDGSTSARLVTDIQDRTLFYNPAFEDLCDADTLPALEVIRTLFASTGEETVKDRFESLVQNAMRGHEDVMEAETRMPGGERRWYRVSAQPVAGWLGTVHWRLDNITDRRAVEVVIREEREKLVDFTDHAPVGFYAMDEHGRFTFVNATLARWLGSDIDSLLNGGTLHAYLEHRPNATSAPYDIKSGGGARQVAELKMKGPAGRIFEAAINQSVVIEAEGKVRVRGVVHDLTAERQMTQALKDSEDRFRRFFADAPLGIAMIDADGVMTDSNQMLADMVSLSPSDLEDKPFTHFVSQDHQEAVKKLLSTVRHKKITSDPIDIDLTSTARTEPKSVKIYASPLRGNNVAVRVFDRTEQKILEEQVTQSQKMQAVGQLAGGVAHDFNNLLTAIIGFCDLLLLRHKAGDPSFNDIQQIKQNSNRASNLVRQLLAFSRQQQLNPKVLDITETLTELSHLIRRLIGVQIDLDLIHGKDLYDIKVDEGQLEQVLINLAVNARDAMAGKGHLKIETDNVTITQAKAVMNETMPVGHWVAIKVTDTGCGIDQQTLERIFEPFFTTKKIGEGTGLGLATVYGIIRQTGGYIDVDSVVGRGTSFIVYLPKYISIEGEEDTAAQEDTQAIEKEIDLTGTATILLVEDEEPVRMFSSRALSNKGYQVLEADSGESGLEVVQTHDGSIDLIVTDVIMPEMDGPTMAQEILKTHPDMPMIFVSGYTEDRFKEEIGDNAHFLPKPFTLQQLATKVKEVLDKS